MPLPVSTWRLQDFPVCMEIPTYFRFLPVGVGDAVVVVDDRYGDDDDDGDGDHYHDLSR